MSRSPYNGPERCSACPPGGCEPMDALRDHFDEQMAAQNRRLAKIEETLGEIDSYFKASKIGAWFIRWAVTVGAAALAGWATLKGLR